MSRKTSRAEKTAKPRKVRAMRIEWWKDPNDKKFYWHVRAVNNKVIVKSVEGSRRKGKMFRTIETLQIGSVSATIVDTTNSKGVNDVQAIGDWQQHTPVPAVRSRSRMRAKKPPAKNAR